MKATLDGTIEFEQTELAIGSWQRGNIERAAAGVDGVVSIDLGKRTREIVQKGLMRAGSRAVLRIKVDYVRAMADGKCHAMETAEGERFENLRIDSIKASSTEYSGRGASCEFEIRYVQLGTS
jgi:hypothetical protein